MNFRYIYLLTSVILLFYFTGNYSISLSSSNKDCQYKPIDEPSQFSASIDGKSFSFTDNVDGIKSGSNSFKNLKKQPDSSRIVFQSYLYKSSGGDVIIELNVGTLRYPGTKPSGQLFENFFRTGRIKFSVMAYDGVEIKYRDKKGVLWSTSNGFQQGSEFEFSEFQKDSNSVKFKAVFKCMLYNNIQESKTLENGVFSGYFLNN